MQRDKGGAVDVGVGQDGAGGGDERRRLVEAAVKGAEDPVEAGNAQGRSEARIDHVLGERALKVGQAQAGDEGEPCGGLDAVGDVLFDHAAVGGVGFVDGCGSAAVVEDGGEPVVVVLTEGVEACLQGVARDGGRESGLRTGVVGGAMDGGGDGDVVGVGAVVGGVGVEERRELEDGGGIEGVQPGEEDGGVGLVLGVAQAAGVVLLCLEVGGAGVVGDLEEVAAELGDEAELVLRRAVGEEGCEAADAVGGVVVDRADGRGEAVVAAIGVEADVVGAALVVVAEAELGVGLEEVAGGEDELGLCGRARSRCAGRR